MLKNNIDSNRLESIGYDPTILNCGNFMVLDNDIAEISCNINGLHIYPINKALEHIPHVRDNLFFKLVDKDRNNYTRQSFESDPVGYYIKVDPGIKLEEPLQAAFLLCTSDSTQIIHNIIELGDNSHLNIVNGCTTAKHDNRGTHIGITETYLRKGSFLGYTMLHKWGPEVEVFPFGVTEVEENSRFISNYVGMTSVKKIVSYPVAHVKKQGSARFYSVIYARPESNFDMGSKAILEGDEASGEIISRVVSEGGNVTSRQMLDGRVSGSLGHMECSGLMINDNGVIHSIPELRGAHPDINLSHEASVGRISTKELSYLMTRGLSEEQARSLIIRGFLDIKIEGIPSKVQELIDDAIERSIAGTI